MKLLGFFLLAFSLTPLHAQTVRGPSASALGGAGVAGMPGAESALLNPALVPLYKESSMDAYFRDGYAKDGELRHFWGFGAIDNGQDIYFPGALHYFRMHDTGRSAQPANGELWHAAIAKQFDQLNVGVSAYRLIYDVKNDRRYTQWNYSIGGLFMLSEGLGVAYVLNNLAGAGSNVPAGLREDLRQVAGVYAKLGEMARVRFDMARQERFNPDHKMTYMLSIETKHSDVLLVRLGYRYDDLAGDRVWTAGIGFDGPRLKMDYAIEKNQTGTPGALHSVDLRLPF
jgi:hypothetical protein